MRPYCYQRCYQRGTTAEEELHQHVISLWLLKAFAGKAPLGPLLATYDKATGAYASAKPAAFMTEVDAHSTAIEQGIGDIEGPASGAARRLAKRVKRLPPGLYAVMSPDSVIRADGPPLSDKGVLEGMRLLVGQHEIPSPNHADRLALAHYAGLMYQRAPGNEAAIMRWGAAFDRGAQRALDSLLPGMQTGLATELPRRRERMLGLATDIGGRLAEANWWVVRAGMGEAFVLGDSPIVAALSLGHDDGWRAILSDDSYVVVMPLSPTVALVVAPQRIIPITGIANDLAGLTQAINRLMWRHALRYVVARNRADLDAAWPGVDEDRRRSVQAGYEASEAAMAARGEVASIVMRLLWRRWSRCRLVFGFHPFPAEDRHVFAGPEDHGGGLLPEPHAISRVRARRAFGGGWTA